MQMQKQPNEWSCLPTAFAMALNRPVCIIIKDIGHDGSEIIWPHLEKEKCRRSFHIQELIYVSFFYGATVTPYEAFPVSIPELTEKPYIVPFGFDTEKRLGTVMNLSLGVITGDTKEGKSHAVAWDGEKIYDPNGTIYGLEDFVPQTFWLVR